MIYVGVDLDQSGIYTTPNIGTLLCVPACVCEGGDGGIDCAGPRTICVPQGVEGRQLE